MSLHDAYARLTPYEIALPDEARMAALASAVSHEAAARGADPTLPEAFVSLDAVGAFLVELHGEDAPRVALLEYGALTYHALRFQAEGRPLYLLGTEEARRLVDGAPDAHPSVPARAGYLQLPQHLFWTGGETGPPESIDGMFWSVSSDDHLHVMPITGLRPDRAGFGMLAVPGAPLGHAQGWLSTPMRDDSEDYSSTMPGAAIDRLYAIETAGEVLKLLARFFARVAEGRGGRAAPAPAVAGGTRGPAPSSLPYLRVA